MTRIQICVVLLCGLFLQGCKSMMASPLSVYGQWTLREVQSAAKTLKVDDPNAPFTMRLTEDQRASGKVACNSWHGQTRIDNGYLQLLATGITRKRCVYDNEALQKIERNFLGTLQRATPFSASETQLQLRLDNDEVWIFERVSS